MDKKIALSQEKFDELTKLLFHKENTERMEVSEAIGKAKEFGDLSENAEYSAAKASQEKLEIEIFNLQEIVTNAYPIDKSVLSTKIVNIGNMVTVYDEEFDEEVTYTIVSKVEVDTSKNKISNESPLGAALIGKKKGETVSFKTPGGISKLKILGITK